MRITHLQNKDINQFLALFHSVFTENFAYYPEKLKKKTISLWSKERLQKRLSSPDYQVFTAIEKGRVVGFLAARFRPQKRSSYINWMGVSKNFQRRGIGKSLINHWEDWATQKGAIMLSASTTNSDNVAYYQHLGYKLISKEVTEHHLTKYRLKKEI